MSVEFIFFAPNVILLFKLITEIMQFNEPIIPIMSDVPIADQIKIYAAVMWVAERRNIPFHKAFYLCMDRYAKLLAMAAIDDISVDEVVDQLYPKDSR